MEKLVPSTSAASKAKKPQLPKEMQHEMTRELWWAACGTGELVGWSQSIPGWMYNIAPFERELTRSGNKVEFALKEEHSLSRFLNCLRTEKYTSCLCAEKLRPWVDQWYQKFKKSLPLKGQRSLWTCSRAAASFLPNVVKYILWC